MVKLYKNKYLRKYKEDFSLHLKTKVQPLDNLSHIILQRYKSKVIWRSNFKRKFFFNLQSQITRELRYLSLRSLKKSSFLWSNLLFVNNLSTFSPDKRNILLFKLEKFRKTFLLLLLQNRHSIFFKDLNIFYKNIYWFSWGKFTTQSLKKIIFVLHLLNWNYTLDFNRFDQLKKKATNLLSFKPITNINLKNYIFQPKFQNKNLNYFKHQAFSMPVLKYTSHINNISKML